MKYFKYRNILLLIEVIIGTQIVFSLTKVNINMSEMASISPYVYTMILAIMFVWIGFIFINPKYLGIGSVFWLVTIAFNIYGIILFLPLFILNVIGRNKMLDTIDSNTETI